MHETALDVLPDSPGNDNHGEPDAELAVILLAAGMSQDYIRAKCGFPTRKSVQAFCRDDDVRREAKELSQERAHRVGKRALVCLEQILNTPQTDLRAQVLAIRTGLEVSGDLKRENAAPAKSVRELSAEELGELIAATRAELDARIARYRAGGAENKAPRLAASGT